MLSKSNKSQKPSVLTYLESNLALGSQAFINVLTSYSHKQSIYYEFSKPYVSFKFSLLFFNNTLKLIYFHFIDLVVSTERFIFTLLALWFLNLCRTALLRPYESSGRKDFLNEQGNTKK